MAGCPARFDGIVQTSLRYMASGFGGLRTEGERRGGRRGRQQQVELLVGALEVAAMSVRTFCALP
jgi:hypothetical protein